MKVVVSACLLGRKCKYNGGDNKNEAVMDFLKDKEILALCPEMAAGVGCPRDPVEIRGGKIVTKDGEDKTEAYQKGVDISMEKVHAFHPDLCILKSKSPTCGIHEIYDGTFTGNKIPGSGLWAKALADAGFPLKDEKEMENEQ